LATHGAEERTKLKKAWVDHAIQLAMQSKWTEAVAANRNILEHFPKDVDAFNRLGRALREQGQYRDARAAYRQAVEIDPNNGIAQKNLTSLEGLDVDGGASAEERVDPRLFIAETGKSGAASLVAIRDRALIAKMTVGDQVYLNPEGRALYARNAGGDTLGQVEPKVAQRLIDLIAGGNKYAAALMSIDDANARVIIHETYQHPTQIGRVSFPTRAEGGTLVRPYTKESLLKYPDSSFEDDDEDGELEEGFQTEGETEGEEPMEPNEFDEEQSE
jgi:tetratricopeptide (TPR) repeat protein